MHFPRPQPGHSQGYKGYTCLKPVTLELYCSTDVAFDETFFPAQEQEQHTLGYFSAAPLEIFPTLIHGLLDAARKAVDNINNMLPQIDTLRND